MARPATGSPAIDLFATEAVSGLGIAAVYLAVLAGAFAQASTGIGLGLVAAPVMAIVDPALVPGPILLLAIGLSVMVAWRDRAAVDRPALAAALAGRLPATAAGVLTVAVLPADWFLALFAAILLAAIALSVAGWRARRTRTGMVVAGAASGYMGTVTGVGAPPMAIVFQHGRGAQVRGTLGAYFLVGSSLSVVALWSVVGGARADLLVALQLAPAVLLGYLMSYPARRIVDAGLLRPAILVICTGSALVLLARALA